MVDSSQRKIRVPGFDVARCLAILAMVFVHYEAVLASGVSSPGWLKALADAFEGRASAPSSLQVCGGNASATAPSNPSSADFLVFRCVPKFKGNFSQ